MAKKIYVEVGGKTRKAKKGYVSVGGKARKIKKAYIGVDGKARAFWSGGELRYYGTATTLSVARRNVAGVSTSHHALFGGGYNGASKTTVEAYDASLTRTTPNALTCGGGSAIVGAPTGQYAVFCSTRIGQSAYKVVAFNAYDSSLTRSNLEISSSRVDNLQDSVSASVQTAAIFTGSAQKTGNTAFTNIRGLAVNASLTVSEVTALSGARQYPTALSIGSIALYAGGEMYERSTGVIPVLMGSTTVDSYNNALTLTSAPKLAAGKAGLASASNGKYALFAGGHTMEVVGNGLSSKKTESNTVDAYDTSLTRTNPTALSATGTFFGASLGNYALFASKSNDVNVYDQSLTRTTLHKLSVERTGVASATIGNYALFAGGKISSDTYSNVVDVYTID